MRTLRSSLAGAVILVLLGGLSGNVLAQDAEVAASDAPHRVTGQVLPGGAYRHAQPNWNDERQVEERRGSYFENPIEMDDPRLSGLLRETWNRDTYGGRLRAGRGEVIAGRTELVNDDGTWVGTMRGYVAYQNPRYHQWHYELTGTDAYEGHSALLHAQGPAGGPWEVEGFVFPGPQPDYPVEMPAE